jgi:hypothetical protein
MEVSFSGRQLPRDCPFQAPFSPSLSSRLNVSYSGGWSASVIRCGRLGLGGPYALGVSTPALRQYARLSHRTILHNKGRQAATGQGRGLALQVKALPEVLDVEEVGGVRVVLDEKNRPTAQYLVKWKSGQPSTW